MEYDQYGYGQYKQKEHKPKFKVGDMVGYDPGLEPHYMRHGVVLKVIDRGEKTRKQSRFEYDCSLFDCTGKYDSIYHGVHESFLEIDLNN